MFVYGRRVQCFCSLHFRFESFQGYSTMKIQELFIFMLHWCKFHFFPMHFQVLQECLDVYPIMLTPFLCITQQLAASMITQLGYQSFSRYFRGIFERRFFGEPEPECDFLFFIQNVKSLLGMAVGLQTSRKRTFKTNSHFTQYRQKFKGVRGVIRETRTRKKP